MVMRNNHILNYAHAKPRNILSLQNWINGNGCIARDETAYLTRCSDLIALNSSHDSATERLEDWIEDKLVRFCKLVRKVVTTHDPNRKLTDRASAPQRWHLEMHMCIYSRGP